MPHTSAMLKAMHMEERGSKRSRYSRSLPARKRRHGGAFDTSTAQKQLTAAEYQALTPAQKFAYKTNNIGAQQWSTRLQDRKIVQAQQAAEQARIQQLIPSYNEKTVIWSAVHRPIPSFEEYAKKPKKWDELARLDKIPYDKFVSSWKSNLDATHDSDFPDIASFFANSKLYKDYLTFVQKWHRNLGPEHVPEIPTAQNYYADKANYDNKVMSSGERAAAGFEQVLSYVPVLGTIAGVAEDIKAGRSAGDIFKNAAVGIGSTVLNEFVPGAGTAIKTGLEAAGVVGRGRRHKRRRIGSSRPTEEAYKAAANAAYGTGPDPPGYKPVFTSDTLRVWMDPNDEDLLVGVRGTWDLGDMKANLGVAFNNLHNTKRYKKDEADLLRIAQKFPASKFHFASHSLGAAIARRLEEKVPTLSSKAYNAAFEPRSILNPGKQERVYKGDDFLGKIGRYLPGAQYKPITTPPSTKVKWYNPSTWKIVQDHFMSGFGRRSGGARSRYTNAQMVGWWRNFNKYMTLDRAYHNAVTSAERSNARQAQREFEAEHPDVNWRRSLRWNRAQRIFDPEFERQRLYLTRNENEFLDPEDEGVEENAVVEIDEHGDVLESPPGWTGGPLTKVVGEDETNPSTTQAGDPGDIDATVADVDGTVANVNGSVAEGSGRVRRRRRGGEMDMGETSAKVNKRELKRFRRYERFVRSTEDRLKLQDPLAPWNPVEEYRDAPPIRLPRVSGLNPKFKDPYMGTVGRVQSTVVPVEEAKKEDDNRNYSVVTVHV